MTRYSRQESERIYMRAVEERVNARSARQNKQHGPGFMYSSRESSSKGLEAEIQQETFSEKVHKQLRQGRAARPDFYPTEDDFRVVVGPSPFPGGIIPKDINKPMG